MASLPRDAPTVLLMVIGIGLLGFTSWRVAAMQVFLAHAVRTDGTIRMNARSALAEFETGTGAKVSFVPGYSLTSQSDGAVVPVAYDPADPSGTAVLDNAWSHWIAPLWMLPAGLVFTVAPLFGARARFGGRYG